MADEKALAVKADMKNAEDDLCVSQVHLETNKAPQNPIVRCFRWVLSFMIPGMGMFCEAYFVFAVGNLSNIWKKEYPDCWKTHKTCPVNLSDSITYTQVCGIIFGQLVLGFAADKIGRKWGSVLTAGIMVVFGTLIVASSGDTPHAIFTMFTIVQFFFGIGVGGEYPIASSSANERAESKASLVEKRGQTVVLVFSMQGWGNLINTFVILAIMAGFGQYGPNYDEKKLEITWRLSYAIGLIPLTAILCYRLFRLEESKVWKGKKEALKKLDSLKGQSNAKLGWSKFSKVMRYYWHRIAGTALSWFVWDFAFYGNKLFQSTFIKIINPKAGLIEVLQWTALNSSVALVGYYFAAFTVDKKWMGRTRMQVMGFMWCFVLFLICAVQYFELIKPQWIHAFQFLYYFSSFWGQFGPNATTWLLPAETMPTEVRSMCHGFSAAVGKAGALVAGVVFNMVTNQTKFYISAFCGLAGVVCTLIAIPNLTGLDLREGDRRWLAILDGAHDAYVGEAVNPKHLSFFERMLGYGRNYVKPAESDHGSIDSVTAAKQAAQLAELKPEQH